MLEIQRTFDFFRATATGEHIRKIYVAGGSARVYGLTELLQQELGLPVEQLDPFHRIKFDAGGPVGEIVSSNPPRLAVAVGLALRSFDDL